MPDILVPDINSEDFKSFLIKLNKAISNSELQKLPSYPVDNFTVKSVTILPPMLKYPEGHCWFNSYIYANHTGGKPIFGWLIFEDNGKKYIAQNHALVQNSNGDLVDPTNCQYINYKDEKGVFVPDLRAKVQFENLRAPATFECNISDENGVWFTIENESHSFLFNKFSPSPELDRFITEQVKTKNHEDKLY